MANQARPPASGPRAAGFQPRATSSQPHPAGEAVRATAAPTRPDGPKKRPDPRPMRLAYGVTGIAAFTALATAIISPATSPGGAVAAVAGAGSNGGATDVGVPTVAVPVVHVQRTVVLQPGQTPPPAAIVTQLPAPSPRVVTIVTTQSGAVVKP